MIKVKKSENQIMITGHAGYAEFGHDIVCASVTSIATTTINAIIRIDREAIDAEAKEGLIVINVLKNEKTVDLLITNMMELLKELEKTYKKYIKIEEVHWLWIY